MTQFVLEVLRRQLATRIAKTCVILFLCVLVLTPPAHAQLTTGSLSGTVHDSTGAIIPKARITLTNQATKDTRTTVSDRSGYFTFAAIQPGTYDVGVSVTGFASFSETGVTMNSGDIRSLPDIQLKVGAEAVSVSVSSSPAQIVPIDSGERSFVISSEDLQKLSLESRNVSELLKILPGVTQVPNGTQGGSSVDFSAEAPTGSTVGVGYSPSGAPYRGGTSYLLDGANIIDPGCNCYSIAVPNPDMTSEVKVESTFGADSPNGPEVINATSKSGTNHFHGEAYFYARDQALNSNTWLNNSYGAAKQPGEYYYPGGNIGGPVLIPGTHFNHNRKLLFWTGYEYYKQTLPAGQPFESYIPSAGMIAGNFTSSGEGNSAICPNGFSPGATNWCNDLSNSFDSKGNPITNPAAINVDAGAAALMKMFPKPNANPLTTPGGYNYVENYSNQQNGYVWRARVDYNLSENMKIFATYQQGTTTFSNPAHVYWNPAYDIPYPGGNLTQPEMSRVLTANIVNVLSPTFTNEFVFGWGFSNSPFSPTNLSGMYKSALGYPYSTVYNTASPVTPSINSAGAQTFPDISQPAFFDEAGVNPLKKAIPTFADNVTKVWRSHTFKAGAFTELVGNNQGAWSFPNGQLSFGNTPEANGVIGSTVPAGHKIGSTNPAANLVMGVASSFSQNNIVPVQDVAYRTTSAYLMDTWKANQRLTLNLGVRWDHIGRWYDRQGLGMAVWLPQLFAQDVAQNQSAGKMVVEYPGVRWHGIDPGIPNGGMPARLAYTSPRFGFAYDLQGNSNTVIRGGWGEYAWNDQPTTGPLTVSQNMQTYNSPGGQAITLPEVGLQQASSGNPQPAGSITAAPYNDYANSLSYAWNLTLDRQMPWKSLLEVAYVGNSTQHLLMGGQSDAVGIGGSGFSNINKIPLGGLFKPDPVTSTAAPSDPENTGTYSLADYEPYSGCTAGGGCYGYGTNSVTVNQHSGYSNYHGLQIAWLKQAGHASFDFNYTWSKSLGIVSSTLDPFSVHGNYGILSIDRPQVFNSSYAYSIGEVYHGYRLMQGVVNGWTVSGITTFQSGGNLQANSSENFGLTIQEPNGSGKNTSGSTETLSAKTWFGTDQGSILPLTTCNPKDGLTAHQLLKFSCFTAPSAGVQGNRVLHPYLSGPIYTDTDLTVFKTFKIKEAQNVQIRASAFNFMNHPLWGSTGGNLLSLKYTTPDGGHTYTSGSALLGVPESGSCSTSGNAAWGCMNQKYPYSGAGYNRIFEVSAKYNF